MDKQRWLAFWLWISHHVGSDLLYWSITEAGKIVSKTSNERVSGDDNLSINQKNEIESFNDADDEEEIDKYLNVELVMDQQTTNERHGYIINHSQGT